MKRAGGSWGVPAGRFMDGRGVAGCVCVGGECSATCVLAAYLLAYTGSRIFFKKVKNNAPGWQMSVSERTW